jgi:O-antigen/teichoic acid export membrane protein
VSKVVRDAPAGDVERLLKLGVLWTAGSQIALQVLRLVTVVALARLLSPDEYGTAALAVMIASYSTILGDLGYGGALVQTAVVSRASTSTAFWCSVAAGATGFTLCALAAFPTSVLLDEPEAFGLIIAGGATLLVVACGSTSNALLTRALAFRRLQLIALTSVAGASVCAVVAALSGAGPWALALQQLVLALTGASLVVIAARWHPSLDFSISEFKRLSAFALPYTASAVLFVLYNLASIFFIGWWVGVEELGWWVMAMTIVVLPYTLLGGPVARVVFAGFARMRDRPERVGELWLQGTLLLSALLLPSLFGLAAVAPDLIPLLLGEDWVGAVDIARILCVFAILTSLVTWSSAVLEAAGKPQVTMFTNAATLIALPIGIWVGSQVGIEAVAAAYVLVLFIFADAPIFLITLRELSLASGPVMRQAGRLAAASMLMFVAVIVARSTLVNAGVGPELRLVLSIVVGAATYALLLWRLSPGIASQLIGLLPGTTRREQHAS